MEAPPMVCYSTGATNSLIEKITPLMESHPMIKVLLQDTMSLRDDLLNKFAGGRATREQVKVWMKLAREIIYDIEDWIDMRQEAASFDESDEKQIDQFKVQIKEARDRFTRYELLKHASTTDAELLYAGASEVGAGPRLLLEKSVLVGMDGPKSELLNRLKQEQDGLKVISIHGTEGLGKTALAKEIYGDIYIRTHFDCHAFVSVGQTTSTKTTLMGILNQVKPVSEVEVWQPRSCNEIITELWRFLPTQRYFICIDGIRSTQDMQVIICSLPENNRGSRILTTTPMKEIAISCSGRPSDFVYEMAALGEADSKSLFLNNVYVCKEEWPDHFKECSNKMLEVCGGVPLAIIITAGLLKRTPEELSVQSEKLRETILSEFSQFYSLSQVLRKILHMSYGDLPPPVKSCFLYLAAFSGSYEIKKDRLIRRWRAEGLIPESPGKRTWETGESYFHKLISRRLIQPVFDDNDDQPIGCTVHGAVFDFVKLLAGEENFVTAAAKLESVESTCDTVRRVSLDCGDKEDDTLIWDTYCRLDQKGRWAALSSDVNPSSDEDEEIYLYLSRVRSLAFTGHAGRIPDLSAFKYIRVLDLEDTMGLESKQLQTIGCLSLLRYLGLCRTDVTKLPETIGALKLLSTLDLTRTSVRKLPELRNKKLISLLGDQLILQRGMEGMQMLEEMSMVLLGPDGSPVDSMARLVHGLSQLRMLGVRFSRLHGQSATERQGVSHLLEEVAKSNLRSLLIDNYQQPLLDILVDSLEANKNHLQKFELTMRGFLPQVPQEIASLTALTHLHINVEAVGAEAVHALGKLPNLVLLKLCSNTSPCMTMSSRDGFQCLKVFWYNINYGAGTGSGAGVGFQFEQGAMPQLRRLRIDLNALTAAPKHDSFSWFGIQHLRNLVEVHATIDWTRTALTDLEVEAEEAHIRELVSECPNSPVLELNRTSRRPVVARSAEELVMTIHNVAEWSSQIDPNKLVVVHFTTSWCQASVAMAPAFADLAKRFRNTVVFLKVDIEANDEMGNIAQQLNVDGVPTFLFIKGGDSVGRVVGGGVEKEKELEDRLEVLL